MDVLPPINVHMICSLNALVLIVTSPTKTDSGSWSWTHSEPAYDDPPLPDPPLYVALDVQFVYGVPNARYAVAAFVLADAVYAPCGVCTTDAYSGFCGI